MCFFSQQFINCFAVHFIWHTAVHRANGSALRLLVKALAFGTLVRSDIINIYGYGSMRCQCIGNRSVHKSIGAFYCGTVCNSPLYPTLIYRVIRTFRFTGAAVDTFIGDLNSHKKSLCLVYVRTKLQLRIKYHSPCFLNKSEI